MSSYILHDESWLRLAWLGADDAITAPVRIKALTDVDEILEATEFGGVLLRDQEQPRLRPTQRNTWKQSLAYITPVTASWLFR